MNNMTVDDKKQRMIRAYFAEEPPEFNNKEQTTRVALLSLFWFLSIVAVFASFMLIGIVGSTDISELIDIPLNVDIFVFVFFGFLILCIIVLTALIRAISGFIEDWRAYQEEKSDYKDALEEWQIGFDDVNKRPETEQIIQWLHTALIQQAGERALRKLAITPEQLRVSSTNGIDWTISDQEGAARKSPIVIPGPVLWETYGIPRDEIVFKVDAKWGVLFSCYHVLVVCLTDERIATYSADYNFLRNAFVNEGMDEFLYRDIVSLSTLEISTNYTLPNGQTLRRAQVFRVAVPSNDQIQVITGSSEITDILGGKTYELTDHEKAVGVIRQMLRRKQQNVMQ